MGAERERVYNAVGRQPAQNLEADYRSRWAVNATGLGRHEDRHDVRQDDWRDDRRGRARSSTGTGGEATVDLTPLMRLAQESPWSRIMNRPRPCPAEI
jgi:hypothetical protein